MSGVLNIFAGAERGLGACLLVGVVLLTSTGCEPWGKPDAVEVPSDQVTDFKILYGENCAGCHGADGKNGPGRILNDALYLSILPKQTLRSVIDYGRAGTAMPAFAHSQGGPLTPKQVDALVDGIESGWARPVNFGSAASPSYSLGDVTGDPANGKKLFLKDCFLCHGPGAKVGSVTSASYLQLVSNQMLRTSIIVGRPDLGMPDYRALNIGKPLSEQDVTDLVSYLASLRPANSNAALANDRPVPPGLGQPGAYRGHVNENGSGNDGSMTKGNEGSGNGPGSPDHREQEGNKSNGSGSSSQRGVK